MDVIIYGTGFTAGSFLDHVQIRGLGGANLRDVWADGPRAYLGMAVPGYPNMFLMYGPNTNLGSGSIVAMLECQAGFIRQAVDIAARRRPRRDRRRRGHLRRCPGAAARQRSVVAVRQLVSGRQRPGDRQLARTGQRIPAAHKQFSLADYRELIPAASSLRPHSATTDGGPR